MRISPSLLLLALPLALSACSKPADDQAPASTATAAATSPSTTATDPAAAPQPQAPTRPATDVPSPNEPTAATLPSTSETDSEGGARARIEALLGDAAQYEQVFNGFRKAVADNDRMQVVEYLRFPLNSGPGEKIDGPGQFQNNYDRLLTPALKKTLAAQDFDKVFVNSQGVMIGRGQVWLNGTCKDSACTQVDVKVITLQP
ncbi:hypothetical protein RZA67_15945 [Stenotrophomonas sp. C3(2023)]|uniref:hypothetical protein n=1 Tax=Stenotrophomonas sp. C3(2023) TaxID=3080277 RepID=UPI00293CBADC|nr:hypothetical protein [Stenotrophomonas sp. C3(2023)]MDV3470215.1 hypothetical protein [Stenotrophomonas sp. C3(2023)]